MCALVDDIVIIARSREEVIEIYKETEEKAGKIGAEENQRETNICLCQRQEAEGNQRETNICLCQRQKAEGNQRETNICLCQRQKAEGNHKT
jgi:hypothetical protein